jgi:hypothetical protein
VWYRIASSSVQLNLAIFVQYLVQSRVPTPIKGYMTTGSCFFRFLYGDEA